ncbi:hypothetical protein J5N97_005104 [Dioscorea zingiberensis]|uniref:Uncharacterized protein n=1 Tax=Dioscorea zingiberensis TaxID=325984 RepID=A0A9D5HRW9_9LILI|nr:hypothetical protein J5N97_005104 [Dioscorea zingiberensis]
MKKNEETIGRMNLWCWFAVVKSNKLNIIGCTSTRSFFKTTHMWKKETLLKMEIEKQEQAKCNSNGEDVVIGSEYEPLLVQPEKSSLVLRQNIQDENRE